MEYPIVFQHSTTQQKKHNFCWSNHFELCCLNFHFKCCNKQKTFIQWTEAWAWAPIRHSTAVGLPCCWFDEYYGKAQQKMKPY